MISIKNLILNPDYEIVLQYTLNEKLKNNFHKI